MRLRTRILLGYGYLVSLLLISAIGAALGFHDLGNSITRVVSENFESVQASNAMIEALERADSHLLVSLLDADFDASTAPHDASFRRALERAKANVTLSEEPAVLERITSGYESFFAASQDLARDPGLSPVARYETEVLPLFEAVKRDVHRLERLAHQAVLDTDEQARQHSSRRAAALGILGAVALLTLAQLSRSLGRDLLDRLTELGEVAEALAAGDSSRRASDAEQDELGAVARQLNALLDRHHELEGTMKGRLGHQRQLVLALLEARGAPAALFDAGGDLLASTFDDTTTEKAYRAACAQRTGKPELEVEIAGGRFHLVRLVTPDGRFTGWLAELSVIPD